MKVDCFNIKVETMEPNKLEEIEINKLCKEVNYLYENSPFNRKKFDAIGLKPEHIKTLDDLKLIPFTTKDELREAQVNHPPLGDYLAAPRNKIIRIHSSSGTTGKPSFIGITHHDREIWTEMASRSYWATGLRPSNTVIFGLGLSFFVGGLPSHAAIENIGATLVPIGTGSSERILSSLENLNADFMACTPSYANYLAEYIRERTDKDPSQFGIRGIHVGAEPGGGIPSVRQKIEKDWGARIGEAMGNADMAPLIWGECEAQNGMHFCGQGYIIPEIIDPETGERKKIEDGVTGELVYTAIDRESSALLRFRTRDHVIAWTSRCSCGRTSMRIRCIGRTDDMLIVLGVNVFPSAVQDVVSGFAPQTTGEIRILLDEPGPLVQPPLKVVVEAAKPENADTFKRELEDAIRSKLIVPAKVTLVPPGVLPRSEMKTQLLVKLYESQPDWLKPSILEKVK